MGLSNEQIQRALLSLIAFVISVSVHEFGHAFVADRLGDRLPRMQGRVTLSPLAHIDLLGTIILPLVAALMPGSFPLIAWGKPVQTNPRNYTRLSAKLGHMVVSLAGPAMNLLLAILVSIVFLILGKSGHLSAKAATILVQYFLALNIALMFFNLIPVPPLDGAAVLAGFLPASLDFIPRALQRYGMVLFFVLFLSGILRVVMRPAYHLVDVWAEALLRAVAT
ncbi:MAG TPA: site-2 protease family protein [Polyangia bacterium]|jgi:Zn-dependent protease|nr:site-2 protease family protein [Polyangia bacterium]